MNPNPPHEPSATAPRKSVVFRVRGVSTDGRNDAALKSALSAAINSRLGPQERSGIQFAVDIVASCYGLGKMICLVDFRGKVPSFLSAEYKDPQKEFQMVMGEADITFDCNFFGFTQLYNAIQPIKADVIAITGLDGHAYGSWRGKGALSRMWLRDFLSTDLPHCRVMTYGYNSKLTGGSRGLERILDYGRSFVEDIKHIRKTEEETRRPLIFIAHSFGGLILAHTLIKAVLSRDGPSEMIYKATYGILFFGTPHKGLLVDDIRRLVASDDHPRHGLLDQLKHKSDSLSDQLADFRNIIKDRKIVSFYETEQTRQLVFNPEAVRWERSGEYITAVDMDSALLQMPDTVEKKYPVRANHSTIVKFDSKEDEAYRIAITILKDFEDGAPQTVAARFGHHQIYQAAKNTPPMTIKAPTACQLQVRHNSTASKEVRFTQSSIDFLCTKAYELFVRLKEEGGEVHLTLKKLSKPLFSFKCALDHLSKVADALLERADPSHNLDPTAKDFATTVSNLQNAVKSRSSPDDSIISNICTDLERHSVTAQALIDKVFNPTLAASYGFGSNTKKFGSMSLTPTNRPSKRDVFPVSSESSRSPKKRNLHLGFSEPHPTPMPAFYAMTARVDAFAKDNGPRLSRSIQLSDPIHDGIEELWTDTVGDANAAKMSIGTPGSLAHINRRRSIASADAGRKVERQSRGAHRGLQHFTFMRDTTEPYIAAPGEWTKRFTSVLPPKPINTHGSSKEFTEWLRKLNLQISGTPSKSARRDFRAQLEKDGQFSDIISRAKAEFGSFVRVRKELEVYQDDKDDDE